MLKVADAEPLAAVRFTVSTGALSPGAVQLPRVLAHIRGCHLARMVTVGLGLLVALQEAKTPLIRPLHQAMRCRSHALHHGHLELL